MNIQIILSELVLRVHDLQDTHTSVMSLCARLIYTIDSVYGVKKACEQHWLLLWRYFDNKRQIKQRLSCNAGQAKFMAATAGGTELP